MNIDDIRSIAETEGWLLIRGAERFWIERFGEAEVFDSDETAEAWVRALALLGSAVHKAAVELIDRRSSD